MNGDEVYRVEWHPGSDQLLGTCFCGAEHLDDDPVEMWSWLLGHPTAHELTASARDTAAPVGAA